MVDVCLYFQVHQPFRLRKYQVFDINQNHDYFNTEENKKICQKVARNCYLPANKIILDLIKKNNKNFKVTFSLTGSVIEQLEKYSPEVIESFKELADTGCVEFLAETYHHSLSYMYSKKEFKEQVELHTKKIKKIFGLTPKVFRNTELVFNNEMAKFIQDMGFSGAMAEGADHILGWRSPDYIYKSVSTDKLKVLLRNYKLSDDVAFRFSDKEWKEFPLTAEKYTGWLNAITGQVVNIFMDYETFGEHQTKETNIMEFLKKFPEVFIEKGGRFLTPCETFEKNEVKGEIDMHEYVSWADKERDTSAWLGNAMQANAMKEIFLLEASVKATGEKRLLKDWRRLTTSDHFYYMDTKCFSDGQVHNYFNPYNTPYEAFITYMNILNDIVVRINKEEEEATSSKSYTISESPHKVVNSLKK
ncbi:MAG: glycoside hydrolase family 57 protein [Nanobdellota archaeon]